MAFDAVYIRDTVEALRSDWDEPGVAVAILKGDEAVFMEGFGYRDREAQLPVTPRTLFGIASVTKAFTTVGMGLLVDEGKLEWDRPVRHYLPWFTLQDSFASERMTPRDLATHRSGLPRHEKFWYNSPLSRRELIERLRYLQPAYDFRTVWHYQNMMYVTAGYLVGELSGSTWEEFTQTRLFDPLGLKRTNLSVEETQKTDDFALPYLKPTAAGSVVGRIPFYHQPIMGPTGGVNSCLEDLMVWLRLHMNGGQFEGKAFIQESTLRETHTPQMLIHDPLFRKVYGETLIAYGMGWFIHPFRGRTLIRHSGGIDGFTTQFAFIPSEKLGIAILCNLNESMLPGILLMTLFDHLLDAPERDWNADFKGLSAEGKQAEEKARADSAAKQVPKSTPSHPLEAFVGDYEEDGYGIVTITLREGELVLTYNGLDSPLTHYHYNIFELYNEMYEDNKWIKTVFHTGLDGAIGGVSLQLELTPGIKPIHFVRRAATKSA